VVDVLGRHWPGVNKGGGAARVVALHDDGDQTAPTLSRALTELPRDI
jgi:hypothetical protein